MPKAADKHQHQQRPRAILRWRGRCGSATGPRTSRPPQQRLPAVRTPALPRPEPSMSTISDSRCREQATLEGEAQFGDGGRGPAEHDGGEPRVPQAHAFEIDARETATGNRTRPRTTPDSRSWASAYGVRSETERAIRIQSPTLNAASAASETGPSESLRSMGRTRVKPGRKRIATMMQQTSVTCLNPAHPRVERRQGAVLDPRGSTFLAPSPINDADKAAVRTTLIQTEHLERRLKCAAALLR